MSKLGDALKDGRIVGWVVIVGMMATVGVGVGVVATTANAGQPAAVVQTDDPALTIDLTGTTANGLADEQETDAAAVVAAEAARVAAEAEAARVAAEQAAAEAERIAAEQAAEEPASDEPAPIDDGIPDGAWPLPWIPSPDPVNAPGGGRWDMSNCFGHGETINGVNYCVP